MKERIVNYLKLIDDMLELNADDINYENMIKEHLVQINFFMHERLIHLIVTVVFAMCTIISAYAYLAFSNIGILILTILLLVLLVPYIAHYYRLENGVQKMYRQYDEMLKRSKKTHYKSHKLYCAYY